MMAMSLLQRSLLHPQDDGGTGRAQRESGKSAQRLCRRGWSKAWDAIDAGDVVDAGDAINADVIDAEDVIDADAIDTGL
jgi:hypothetical protein